MIVTINTFQTDTSYLHQMNDSEDYILATQELEATDKTFPVCLSLEDEKGNIIASSGCYPEFPTLTKQFVQEWFEGDFSEIEIIETIECILWEKDSGFMTITENNISKELLDEETFEEWLVGNGLEITLPKSDLEELEEQWNSLNHLYEIVCEESENEEDEPNAPTYQQYQSCERKLYRMVDNLKNQLLEIPSEIKTFTDMYGNVYHTLKECEKGELRHKLLLEEQEEIRMAEYYKENPRGGNGKLKHKLAKRKDLPKKVDFSLLPNASGIIWSALTLLKDGAIDINHEIYQNAVKTANNLELFMQLMKNPKFATKASFEIENVLNHGKN